MNPDRDSLPRTPPIRMEADARYEAGIFALAEGCWTLLQRRTYPDRAAASRWMRSRAEALQQRHPEHRIRGSAVPLGAWPTLDDVLADYEAKRKSGEPEFTPLPSVAPPHVVAPFTDRQGQYLAFIHAYTRLHGQPPAEADLQRYFDVTPPVVEDMILTLERKRLITRVPGAARSIQLLVPPERLPPLQ